MSVRTITQSALPRGDRITIELSQEVEILSDRVANPDRVFFDFANASAAASFTAQTREIKSSLIKSIRIGRPTPGVTRVVLELAGAPRHSAFPLYGPFRLVVDLETESEARPVATAVRRARGRHRKRSARRHANAHVGTAGNVRQSPGPSDAGESAARHAEPRSCEHHESGRLFARPSTRPERVPHRD